MPVSSVGASAKTPPWLLRLIERPGGLWLFIGAYLGLHALVRLIRGAAYERDEAQQLIFTQVWQLGYGRQPPLYNWLQTGLFELTGAGTPGLVLLKYGLLLLFAYSVHGAARTLGMGSRRAALATLGLLLIPDLIWFVHRDLTHSVLAMTLAAAALWLTLRVLRSGLTRDYVLLGVIVGMGIMTKHLFWLWAAGLIFAGLVIAPRRLLNPRMLLTLLLGLLVAAPYLWWSAMHLQASLAGTGKLGTSTGEVGGLLTGAWAYLTAVLVYLPSMLYLAWTFNTRRPLQAAPELDVRAWRLLLWATLGALSLNLLAVLASGGTSFKSRWLLPSLFVAPMLVAGLQLDIHSTRAWRTLQSVLLVLGIGIPVTLAARYWAAPVTGAYLRIHFPGTELASRMLAWRKAPRLVIAQDKNLAGNLAHRLGGATVFGPRHDLSVTARAGDELWLVWRATAQPPRELARFVAYRIGAAPTISSIAHWRLPKQLERQPSVDIRVAVVVLSAAQAEYLSRIDPYQPRLAQEQGRAH